LENNLIISQIRPNPLKLELFAARRLTSNHALFHAENKKKVRALELCESIQAQLNKQPKIIMCILSRHRENDRNAVKSMEIKDANERSQT